MIPASFDYVRATSLAQAIALLQKDTDGSKLVAGGHTLIPTLKLRLASPALLIDIRGIDELKGIEFADRIRIGALTTHAELLASEPLRKVLPIFHQAAEPDCRPAGSQSRHDRRLAGQCRSGRRLAGGRCRVEGRTGAGGPGRPPARCRGGFLRRHHDDRARTGRSAGGDPSAAPDPATQFRYRKIRHPASGYAVVGVAVALRLHDGVVAEASIGITGATGRAFCGGRRKRASDRQAAIELENIASAAALASEQAECLSDHYASADYRKHLVKTEVARALTSLSDA